MECTKKPMQYRRNSIRKSPLLIELSVSSLPSF